MTDTPKERPILFNAEMVRAVLDGRKTQTRRIAKITEGGHVKEVRGHRRWHPRDDNATLACPLGQPGDLLWVRETWGDCTTGSCAMSVTKYDQPWYRADADTYGLLGHDGYGPVYAEDILWRPSIHMPRQASRITLRITDVCVQRLHDISEDDAHAEGVTHKEHGGSTAREGFQRLWDSINGNGAWAGNPWVWAMTFERVKP